MFDMFLQNSTDSCLVHYGVNFLEVWILIVLQNLKYGFLI